MSIGTGFSQIRVLGIGRMSIKVTIFFLFKLLELTFFFIFRAIEPIPKSPPPCEKEPESNTSTENHDPPYEYFK